MKEKFEEFALEDAAENVAKDTAEGNFGWEDNAITEHNDKYQMLEDNVEGSNRKGSNGEGSNREGSNGEGSNGEGSNEEGSGEEGSNGEGSGGEGLSKQ